MAPPAVVYATTLNNTAAEALAHINNATRALSGLLNTTIDRNSTQETSPSASNAFSDAFTTGIQIVQIVALGVLLVLSAITLFHCREQAKKESANKNAAADEKIAGLSEKVTELKGRLVEVGDAVNRVEADMRERGKKRVEGASAWEGEVLKRIRGI